MPSTDTLGQLNRALAGTYEIEREIGAGGMATVYLARDLKHDRHVALKVLKPELGAVLGVDRFLAEIKVTANLQHPNLLPLFDSGEADGLLYYVMPFVDGETLRARLAREHQLPVGDAVRIATAVAGALDYAHRRGIIHRDLKPENILMHEGQPLVADFGIALAVSNAGGSRITQTGLSLGTPQYMSPEQAAGDRQIDGRTDIYSLGAVTYEMLAGEPPHIGATAQAVIARVLTDRPSSVRIMRPSVPPHVDAALQTALEKVPADRFATAKQFAEALSDATADAKTFALPVPASLASRRAPLRDPIVLALASLVLLLVATSAAMFRRSGVSPVSRTVSLSVESTADRRIVDAFPAASPDGRFVAFVAESAHVARVYVRAIDQLTIRALPGTERAYGDNPMFFSPDGIWLAFVADAKLKRVRVDGSQPSEVMANASDLPQGGSWSADGSVIFAPDVARGLVRITPGGGKPTVVTTPDRSMGHIGYAWPDLLPDGKAVLYALITRDGWSVGVHTFASHENRILLPGATMARYVAPGTLLYVQDGRLHTVGFDPDRRVLTGRGVPVSLEATGGVRAGGAFLYFTAASSGTVAIVEGARLSSATLMRVDRSGHAVAFPENTGGRSRISPLGDAIITEDSAQLSVLDVKSGGTPTRLTSGAPRFLPIWSPDGARIVFTSYQDGTANLYMAPLANPNAARRLIAGDNRRYAGSWSANGNLAFVEISTRGTGMDIWVLPISGDSVGKPSAIVATEANDYQPSFSPDGTMLAFTSDRTGRAEVYVQPFPGGGTPRRVSAEGGSAPVWNRNGRELFYLKGNQLQSVPVSPAGSAVEFGQPRALFEIAVNRVALSTSYDVSPDGSWFVVTTDTPIPPRRLDVVVGWRP